jgi:putative FmdB family regulatory protein
MSLFATIMPTYDYECTTCGHQFEARQSMKDPHLTDCPEANCAGPVKRKIGKGSGFIITDYRSDSYKAAAKADSASSSSAPAAPAPAAAPAASSSSGS